MIRIVIDTHGVATAKGNGPVVSDLKAYVSSRSTIRSALEGGRDLRLYVTSLECARWYWDLSGQPGVEILDRRPSSLLAEKLAVRPDQLPQELSNKDIVDLGLLNKEPPLEPLETVTDSIVGMVCGVAWAIRKPSWRHISLLVQCLLQSKGKAEAPKTWITKRISQNTSEWMVLARGTLRDTYEKLLKRPYENTQLVAAAVRLGSMSSYLWDVLDNLNEDALDLGATARSVELPQSDKPLPLLDGQIKHHVSALLKMKDVADVVKACSGVFLSELEAVSDYLRSRNKPVTQAEIDQIRARFANRPGADKDVDEIEHLVPPPQPQEPSTAWGWSEWKAWLVEQYLPYSCHCHGTGCSFQQVAEYGEKFAEWVWRSFPMLLVQGDPLVVNVSRVVRELLAENCFVILIIVDGLGWHWLELLIDAFAAQGYGPVREPMPLISMIPSDTEISKPCILGGCRRDEVQGDESLLLRSQFPKGMVVYCSNLERLRQSMHNPGQLHCCHFRDLDTLLHQPQDCPRMLWKKSRQCLELLAGEVAGCLRKYPVQSQIRMVVVGDHGSVNLKLFNRFVQIPLGWNVSEISDCRFMPVSEPVPEEVQGYYILHAADYGLPKSYAVARGYAAIEQCPRGYAHGGLSPEETIVPLVVFGSAGAHDRPILALQYDGRTLRRGKVEFIDVVVKNLTDSPLRRVRVRLPEFASELQIDEIPPLSEGHSPEPCKIRVKTEAPTSLAVCPVQAVVQFSILGRNVTRVVDLRLKVARLEELQAGESIEDLL